MVKAIELAGDAATERFSVEGGPFSRLAVQQKLTDLYLSHLGKSAALD